MPRPDVSVVIPTYRRETRLAFALEALAAQTLERDRFEVIVVRPPGAGGPFAPAPEGLAVRFEEAARASRPGQRNHGWRLAAAGLVAFTDDDCRPSPEWLEALLAEANGDSTVVQGRTRPGPRRGPPPARARPQRRASRARARGMRPATSPIRGRCSSASTDSTSASPASGEDTDLGLRALEAGAEVRFSERALVHHAVEAQPLGAAIRSALTKWETTPLVYREHPEHRRHLFAGLFFNRTHAEVCAALAGLLARRRHPLAAAALLAPFVSGSIDRANVGPRGLVRQLVHLPARFLRELAMVAGIVRGAARHRSPMA